MLKGSSDFQRVRALNLVSPVGQVWGKSWDRSIELSACSDTQGPPSDGILTFKPCFPHLRKHHETSLKGTVSSLEPPFPGHKLPVIAPQSPHDPAMRLRLGHISLGTCAFICELRLNETRHKAFSISTPPLLQGFAQPRKPTEMSSSGVAFTLPTISTAQISSDDVSPLSTFHRQMILHFQVTPREAQPVGVEPGGAAWETSHNPPLSQGIMGPSLWPANTEPLLGC